MQFRRLTPVLAVCLLPLLSSLSGCNRDAVSAPVAKAAAYQFVTQHRPVSLQAYHAMSRGAYSSCVTVAKQNNQPVKPFVTIPPDFVAQRDTMQSDGVSYYWKTQTYELNVASINPEQGCATRIEETVSIERIGRGKIDRMGIGADGTAETTSAAHDSARADNSGDIDELSGYTVARKENGIALKCLPPGAPVLQAGMGTEMCLVDAGDGRTLRSSRGDALVAFARVTSAESLRGVVMIEPVSLALGKFDSTVFTGSLK